MKEMKPIIEIESYAVLCRPVKAAKKARLYTKDNQQSMFYMIVVLILLRT